MNEISLQPNAWDKDSSATKGLWIILLQILLKIYHQHNFSLQDSLLMSSPRLLFILWEIEKFRRLRRLRQLSCLMIKAQQISINHVLLFLMSNGCVRDYWCWQPAYDMRVSLRETRVQIYTWVAMSIVAYSTWVVKEDGHVCTQVSMDIVVYVNTHIEK